MRLALFAALLLTACGPVSGSVDSTASAPAASSAASSVGRLLYVTEAVDGSGLMAVDPLTLGDRSSKPLLAIERAAANPCRGFSGTCALVTASADASALAVIGYSENGAKNIAVFDARTGALRSRPNPEVAVIVDGLSADGTRIHARNWPPGARTDERVTLDAGTGRVLSREPAFSLGGDEVASVVEDEGRRLYALIVPSDPAPTGPRSVELGAWDLQTGAGLWRLALPSLLAGEWLTGRRVPDPHDAGSTAEVRSRLVPGIALSPDRRQLAVVSTCCIRSGTVWLVDAAGGGLISQRAYGAATSILERLFAPSVALAKSFDESTAVRASFGADGRVLHVYGDKWRVDDLEGPKRQYLGMVAVELESGKVLGSDIKMEVWWFENEIAWSRASSDGKWLYVFLKRTPRADPGFYALRRLDARTLAVLAERRFDSFRYGFMLRGA